MYRRLAILTVLLSLSIPSLHAQALPLLDVPKPVQPSAPQSPTQATPSPVSEPQPIQKEDWSVLPLSKSGLSTTAFNAVRLQKYEQPEFTRELLRVQWRAADPIDLYVVLPHGIAKPPVILYLYDYRFDTDRFRDDGWCKRATKGGVAAVGFVSALSGQRFHAPRPMKEWFVSELQESLATSTHDVQMILNYLAARADVDVSKVGMFGQGTGGTIAVLAAQADARIAVLDLLNPWGDWPDWLKNSPQIPENERGDYLKPEFLQRVSALDPVLYLPKLKLKGLRIQQVMDDTVTPAAAKDKIAAAVQHPQDVVRYKDTAAHRNAWLAGGLSSWITEQFRADEAKSR